jgi:RNA polymerase sigma factor (sigma-70 family)
MRSRLDRDLEDLIAIGHVAILEAKLTHDPKKIPEKQWVARVVRWRIVAEAALLHEQESREITGTDPDPGSNGLHDQEVGIFGLRIVRAISTLSPREQAIVDGLIRGKSLEELGQQLGISRQRVHQHQKEALVKLRKRTGLVVD